MRKPVVLPDFTVTVPVGVELLQSGGVRTVAELAGLGVDERTVRRTRTT